MQTSSLAAFHEAVAYTESLIGPTAPPAHSRAEMAAAGTARLARTRRLLDLLGNPHRTYRIIHVGGTSGKGSTATLMSAVLRASGYRVGLHTSPYVQSPVEKIDVDGRLIGPEAFADLVERCRPAVARMAAEPCGAPSYVELWTAMALLQFAREGVDYGVVEVSAGGRFDATNVVEPVVSAITTVGYDHMQALGHHLTDIAWHKAGIIKDATPAVTGAQQPEAIAVLEAEAAMRGAPLRRIEEERDYRVLHAGLDGTHFSYLRAAGTAEETYVTRLLGRHQAGNAALALAALDIAGIAVPSEARGAGLASAHIPGRLEVVQRHSADGPLVVLDGAHNAEKAFVLSTALRELFTYRKLVLVMAVLQGKTVHHVLDPLLPLADGVIATEYHITGKPSMPAKELAAEVAARGVVSEAVASPRAALDRALATLSSDDIVCVTGSLYLVGQVRERWVPQEQLLHPPSDAPLRREEVDEM